MNPLGAPHRLQPDKVEEETIRVPQPVMLITEFTIGFDGDAAWYRPATRNARW
jgi:hypothetical protein